MSSLGITLLILVFIGIGGVIGYNAWMVRREGRTMGDLLQDRSPALDINRAEPSLDDGAEQAGSQFEISNPAQNFVAGNDSDDNRYAASRDDKSYLSDPPETFQASQIADSVSGDPTSASSANFPSVPGKEVGSVDTDVPVASREEAPEDTSETAGIDIAKPSAGQAHSEPGAEPESDDQSTVQSHVPGSEHGADPADPDESTETSAGLQEGLTPVAQAKEAAGLNTETKRSMAPGNPDEPSTDPGTVGEHADSVDSAESAESAEPASVTKAIPPAFTSLTSDGPQRFDCIVCLQPLDNVTGSRLADLTNGFSRVGAKPVSVTGIESNGSGAPSAIESTKQYSGLVFAVLLVNRHGPLNAMEYSEFVNRIQTVADELDVLADVPDMNPVLEHSRNLDGEIGTLDAQVAITVLAEKTLNPGDLSTISKQLNLTEQGNNRFVRVGKNRVPVFSVSLGDKANKIVLLLDVPRVSREGAPLREMVECAWKCAQAFDGRMVDDAGQPIDNALFERIERQLDTHYQTLQAAGVPAGSAQAMRIFN